MNALPMIAACRVRQDPAIPAPLDRGLDPRSNERPPGGGDLPPRMWDLVDAGGICIRPWPLDRGLDPRSNKPEPPAVARAQAAVVNAIAMIAAGGDHLPPSDSGLPGALPCSCEDVSE